MADYDVQLVTSKPKARLALPGVTITGGLDAEAITGGTAGNSIRVALATGPTGAGNEDLLLRVGTAGDDITVEFSTDGAGASVTPTAQQVADLVNADPQASVKILLSCSSDGTGLVVAVALTNLAGGLESSSLLVIDGDTSVYVAGGITKLVSALVPGDVFSHTLEQAPSLTVLTAGAA